MDDPERFDHDFAAGCLHGSAPFCRQGCPFHLDVRAFIAKIKRGAWLSAYGIYQQAVVFPKVVSALCTAPCTAACPLQEKQAAVRLADLERAAVAMAGAPAFPCLNIPGKQQRVAVIGAGPSGLACAVRLGMKKYAVTVYERQSDCGGVLKSFLPEQIFREELRQACAASQIQLRLDCPAATLEEVAADAVYIATGSGGADFGAIGQPLPGVFLGGLLLGGDVLTAIAAGIETAQAIEAFLKTGAMALAQAKAPDCVIPRPLLPADLEAPILPAGAVYTREEARQEAGRCLDCDCDRCYLICDFMRHYRKRPVQLANMLDYGLNEQKLFAVSNTRLANSCSDCGACRQNCPIRIDTGYQISLARQQMFARGAIPPAYHDYLLRDMAHAHSPAAFLFLAAPSGHNRYLFFPGCQMGASDPQYVKKRL